MSASSMASIAVQRARQQGAQPRARGPGLPRAPEGDEVAGAVATDNAFTAAMSAVTTYIPTDVLTLYVAGSAIFLGVDAATSPDYDKAWAIFVGGLLATPVVNIL